MTRTESELLTILARAHAILDRRGVMPARPHQPWTAPDVCPTCGRLPMAPTEQVCDNWGSDRDEAGASYRPGLGMEPLGGPTHE